jgi:hypothetical protein
MKNIQKLFRGGQRGGIGPLGGLSMKTDTTLSRRRLLAGVPAVAAAGVPSVATALGGFATGGDAELIALGRELAPLVAEVNAARAIDRTGQSEFEARLAALGLKNEKDYDNADAYNQERWRLCRENKALLHEDRIERHRPWDDMLEELFALRDDILDIQPTTLEGFAVQVLVVVTAYDDLCDEDSDSEPPALPEFYRNMCGFVGVPLPEAAA